MRSNRFLMDGAIFSVVRSYTNLVTRNRGGAMDLVEKILQGDTRSAARLISLVENASGEATSASRPSISTPAGPT
jgi:hypothetical protein